MKLLSIRLAFLAIVLFLAVSGFTKKAPALQQMISSSKTATPPSKQSAAAPKSIAPMYYFYIYPDDFFWDYKTTADEETELWNMYGAMVDQSTNNGTEVARGFISNVYPHNFNPSVFLFAHF